MKKILLGLLLTCSFLANAQLYNNEWIDYSKTYYKFKVGRTGLYRIPQSALAVLGNATAADFQLWRNGVQVPLYTSAGTGALSPNDYIEFWGEMNDGKPDQLLYRNPDYQLNDKWSLETDSATYFLTINPGGNNLRLTPTANTMAGNTLAPEPYFMHTQGMYFRDKINAGYGVPVGEYIYSSSYDKGEGWTSNDIDSGQAHATDLSNLFVYSGGPNATFTIALSGNAIRNRFYRATINKDSVAGGEVGFFNYARGKGTFPVSVIANNTAHVEVTNRSTASNDRMVIHQYTLTYPRQFNFGGAANFEFILPANNAGNYLEITGFSYGSTAPVLYDITNGKRYVADLSAAPTLKIALLPSATERRLVLVNAEAANTSAISNLQSLKFTDYTAIGNQADYIIISNPLLYAGVNGTNPVEDYRSYRSSAAGGSYTAKIFAADDLVDQFGFGIKKHPLALQNFLRFARNKFSAAPKQVFLIGKAVNYVEQRYNEGNSDINKLNLVPTFGWPASDILLSANPGSSVPETPIGRLAVISAQEVATYLKKVKDYEGAQQLQSPSISDKAWMKNVVHAVGASEPGLQSTLEGYMNKYKNIISDTLFGGSVNTFSKNSTSAVQQLSSAPLDTLFSKGISLFTYFGHSSSTLLEFNLETPENYNNRSKYPMFIALGCNAGNFYTFDTKRFFTPGTLSEKFVLAQDRGSIGFIASTNLGIVDYLDIYNTAMYQSIASLNYGKPIGTIMQAAIRQSFAYRTQEDFYIRTTCEEAALNGDPAITINSHAKPDYAIEDPLVKVTPSFVSIAEPSFKINAKILNIGKAINQPVVVEIKRTYPDGSTKVVARDTLTRILYADSIAVTLPVDAVHDKGANKITVTVDPDNAIDELFKTNNSVTKDVFIYEDEARPVYPYNFSIVSRQGVKLVASTANVFSTTKQYKMELDTTALFNSSVKTSKSITTSGGIMEFDPGITFSDNTVYYWRVALVSPSGILNWNTASFIYMANHAPGFNQSHLYQHLQSTGTGIAVDSVTRGWQYNGFVHNLLAKNAIFPYGGNQDGDFTVAIDGDTRIRSACVGHSLIFNVFDKNTFTPWSNVDANGNSLYLYGSGSANCTNRGGRQNNFEFSYMSSDSRKKIMDFMDIIPEGSFIVVRSFDYINDEASTWRADTSIFGSNTSLYHKLLAAGFTEIDSLHGPRAWALIYKKGGKGFGAKYAFTKTIYDAITVSADMTTPSGNGFITSPQFGPSRAWKQLEWNGAAVESTPGDHATVDIIGIQANGKQDVVLSNIETTRPVVDISSISAAQYPYLQLRLHNIDTTNFTPYQLKYWRLTYDPVPEGALAPNLYLQMKDTLGAGENMDFKVAFKNISDVAFDSLKVKVVITDKNNVSTLLPVKRYKPLSPNDTITVSQAINTKGLRGINTLYVEVNPDNDQPEQYHFNNFGYKSFYVISDTLNPLLDVTFDNTHILNHDIVSSKPDILIRLQDESKFLWLDDTSLVKVQVRYPNGDVRQFHFNNDSMQFIPARPSDKENVASIKFKPSLTQDGDYELIVTGRDKSNNGAGSMEYRVGFQVINKAMISNMLNYPNPFTTATAFVFTITGSEVPQNIKIQILTVTGKIVREITKEELGPLHVGRNITEFKWNGTDQYGQKVGNGVYLYRVVTNLNGKSLEKYKSESDNTDKYFNKGYGKMYLMR